MPARGADPDIAHQVKAAFLFNFAKFIEWPAAASQAPLVVCVGGDGELQQALEMLVAGKTANGRTIVVKGVDDPRRAPACDILFLAPVAESRLVETLQGSSGRSVLTVGDQNDAEGATMVIRFFEQDSKIRFTVDLQAASRAGLRISSKLLSVAKIVRDTGEGRSPK